MSRLIKEGQLEKSDGHKSETKIDGEELDRRLDELNAGKSEEQLQEEESASRFVIDHESIGYIYWVALMTLCGFYSLFIVAYQIAFHASYDSFDGILAVEWIIDLFFIADLVSGFFVSYYKKNVKITLNYDGVVQNF